MIFDWCDIVEVLLTKIYKSNSKLQYMNSMLTYFRLAEQQLF